MRVVRTADIVQLVMDGDVDAAMAATSSHYPHLLAQHPDLLFQLHCRKFIELIRAGATSSRSAPDQFETIMRIGHDLQRMSELPGVLPSSRRVLSVRPPCRVPGRPVLCMAGPSNAGCSCGNWRADRRRGRQSVFGLLAYENPAASPLAQLLDTSERETVAMLLNSAILKLENQPTQAPLETTVRQLAVCLDALDDFDHPASRFVTVRSVFQD